ncbi:MAG: ClpXP protease specificity-enhancing factor [Proteobacteria bacterium]|nr:ClpXP protease specificity-enhancing factor [Pseudomonadota bacterium]
MKPRRPYLLRGLYDWIVDSGEVPNILVDAEIDGVVVPTEHVRDGQIVLNISPQAVRNLNLGNEYIMCEGRLSGRSIELVLPIESVRAIYCRDSGQGLAFDDEDMLTDEAMVDSVESASAPTASQAEAKPASGKPDSTGSKPTLRLV